MNSSCWKWWGYILAFSCLLSCKEISPKEELNNLLSKDATKSLKKGTYNIKATYLPLRYFELRELVKHDNGIEVSAPKIESIKERVLRQYGNGIYFKVEISNEDMSDQTANVWQNLIITWSYEMRNYLSLTTPVHEDVEMVVYDIDNLGSMSSTKTLLAAFPKVILGIDLLSEHGDVQLILDEFGLGIGRTKFIWDVEELREGMNL